VSALFSLPSLTFVELIGNAPAWPQLLPLLSVEAATPLLLRLKTLLLRLWYADNSWLRGEEGAIHGQHDALLSRLTSLPEPAALQRFCSVQASHRVAGLQSLFSLLHLTSLTLIGEVRSAELAAFASSLTAATPLVSLQLPTLGREPGDIKTPARCAS
jgi:hypothetical protein